MNNYKKYLPSRKFLAIVLIIVFFIALYFMGKGVISFFKNRKLAKKDNLVEVTIGGVIQKDSNNNGFPDYEEYLWGLDPAKNGAKNKEYILAKKKELTDNGVISMTDSSATKNDMLSREFFAAIISLQQTGDLNEESMKSVSESLGKNITATPIDDRYISSMLTLVNSSSTANENYREALGAIITKYENANIGSELTFIIQGITKNDPQALYAAKTVADAYISFSQDLMKMSVPRSIINEHLNMANNYEKTGQTINNLAQTLSDPILGMKAIINYKKYSDLLASDLEKLYGILQ